VCKRCSSPRSTFGLSRAICGTTGTIHAGASQINPRPRPAMPRLPVEYADCAGAVPSLPSGYPARCRIPYLRERHSFTFNAAKAQKWSRRGYVRLAAAMPSHRWQHDRCDGGSSRGEKSNIMEAAFQECSSLPSAYLAGQMVAPSHYESGGQSVKELGDYVFSLPGSSTKAFATNCVLSTRPRHCRFQLPSSFAHADPVERPGSRAISDNFTAWGAWLSGRRAGGVCSRWNLALRPGQGRCPVKRVGESTVR